jgi:drug/metabolite transporter (DMT)-like permease
MHISPLSFLLLVALSLLWGGSFFFAEIALRELGPLTIAFMRVGLAVPVLALFVWLRRAPLARSARIWGAYLVMGTLNNAIPFSLIFWGQMQIESGIASILNGTSAVFGVILAAVFFRDEALSFRKVFGVFLALGGVAVILGPNLMTGLDPRDLAQMAVLLAALSYAMASVWAKLTLAGQRPEVNALGMLMGSSLLLLPMVFWLEGVPSLSYSGPVWAAILGLAIGSTALAYLFYFAILARAGAANLMLVTLMIPPIAALLGAWVLEERFGHAALGGFGLIALGLLITDGRILRHVRAI